jgi:hypothetical protein
MVDVQPVSFVGTWRLQAIIMYRLENSEGICVGSDRYSKSSHYTVPAVYLAFLIIQNKELIIRVHCLIGLIEFKKIKGTRH